MLDNKILYNLGSDISFITQTISQTSQQVNNKDFVFYNCKGNENILLLAIDVSMSGGAYGRVLVSLLISKQLKYVIYSQPGNNGTSMTVKENIPNSTHSSITWDKTTGTITFVTNNGYYQPYYNIGSYICYAW